MKTKLLIMTTMVCAGFLSKGSYGESYSHHSKSPQFYAGLSGGWEWMRGNRNDSANEQGAAPGTRVTTTFADNQSISSNNVVASLLAGVWWKPSRSFLVGPEVFLGRGNTISSLKDSRFDVLAAATRVYVADLQRRYFYGALIKAGYQFCKTYTAYLGVGFDQSQFRATKILAVDPATGAPGTPTTFANRTKWLGGILFGVGIEKQIECFSVGLDFRMTQYRKFSLSDSLIVNPLVAPGSMSFSTKPKVYQGSLRVCYHF
jgi:hypothetical protein